jgi:Tfp pilus assembly protein PilV
MINRQKGIFIGAGVVLGVACLGIGVLFFNALSTSREAEQQRDLAYQELKSLYQSKVFPKIENIKRIQDDQKELEAWEANVSNFLAKASVKADDLTPVRFKQALQTTVRELASKKSEALKSFVAGNFKFGFDRYLGDSDSLPQTADVPKLAQQLHLIQAVVRELYEANITKLTSVERETFEADTTERPGRPNAPARPMRPTTPGSRPGQTPSTDSATMKSDAMNPILSSLLTRQRLTFGFQAKSSGLMAAMNRLVAMDAFVVISSVEFTKSGDSVMAAEERKKASAKGSGEKKTARTATATTAVDVTRDRWVTDPEREPLLDVIVSVDVYLFKGV